MGDFERKEKTRSFTFRLTERDFDALEKYAASQRMETSTFFRELCKWFLYRGQKLQKVLYERERLVRRVNDLEAELMLRDFKCDRIGGRVGVLGYNIDEHRPIVPMPEGEE